MTSHRLDTSLQPTIVGPAAWSADGPPPQFRVDTAGRPLYMVELAADRRLMASIVDRTPDNYFYGGDAESVFATGPGWSVPAEVWARLGGVRVLYYRVVAFDHAAGESAVSVDDQNLIALPALVVETAGQRRREARS